MTTIRSPSLVSIAFADENARIDALVNSAPYAHKDRHDNSYYRKLSAGSIDWLRPTDAFGFTANSAAGAGGSYRPLPTFVLLKAGQRSMGPAHVRLVKTFVSAAISFRSLLVS
jgi:hypothetical protein